MTTVLLTDLEVNLLLRLCSDSRSERERYLEDGNPNQDYGEEWPLVARTQALFYRQVSDMFMSMGYGAESGLCLTLADKLDQSAQDYVDRSVGNWDIEQGRG